MDFGKEKISKLLLAFSVPCVISMLIDSIYNIVDQIFIGFKIGYLGNGATTVIFPLIIIGLGLGVMFSDGGSSFLSLNLGEKDYKEAKKGVGATIFTTFVVAVLLGITFSAFLTKLIMLFGCTENIYPYALAYGRIIVLGIPFMMMTIVLNAFIRADGSPSYAMFSICFGAILNIILDPIFLFVFELGMEGAALATITGQISAFLISAFYYRNFKTLKLSLKDLKFDKAVFKVMKYGSSSLITQLISVIVVLVINNYLKVLGAVSIYGPDIPITVFGIVSKVNQIFTSIVVGIAVGAQPIIGYNYGAKKFDRVRETVTLATKVCLIVGLVGTICFQFFPQNLTNLFGNGSDLYNQFSVLCFRIFLMFVLFNSFQIACTIFFQALGKPGKANFSSLSRRIIIFVPAVVILSKKFGLMGILYAAPVADFIAFFITLYLFNHEMKFLKANRQNADL